MTPEIRKFLKYLPDARAAASRSKDRSTAVGAVVLDDDYTVLISGYNGFPRGVDDNVAARHERPLKYRWTAHSEENCVAQAARVGARLKGGTLLVTALHPCTTCSRMIINAGIVRVLAPAAGAPGDGAEDRHNWDDDARIAMEMLGEAGVEVVYYDN